MILSYVSFHFNTFLLFFQIFFVIQLQNFPFYLRMERDIFESVLAITSLPKKPSKKATGLSPTEWRKRNH